MKLAQDSKKFETNVDESSSMDFSIGDASVVIEILRNRLYSNKIQTLVQEYMCNARDSVREAGLNRPIEVVFPTNNNAEIKFRDFGVGITPDRMANVFIRYGASTKRGTNTQSGCFGIGAKSAFAYTDSFTIATFIDGIKRVYIAHIGANQNGRLDLVSETETTEKNGTEISITVKKQDIPAFSKAIIRCSMFWEESEYPVFIDADSFYSAELKEARAIGTARFMGTNLSAIEPSLDYTNAITLVVDGIPYGMPSVQCPEFNTITNKGKARYLNVFIPNGLVSISASREKIDDSEITKAAIKQLGQSALKEFEKALAKWDESIVDTASLVVAKEKACGFNLSSSKAFDFVMLKDGSYKVKTYRTVDIPSAVAGHGVGDSNLKLHTERMFELSAVSDSMYYNGRASRYGKPEFEFGNSNRGQYYMRKRGARDNKAIANFLISNPSFKKANIITIIGERERFFEVDNELTGKKTVTSMYERDESLADEAIEIAERLGYKDIEVEIPKAPKAPRKPVAARPKGNVMMLQGSEFSRENIITIESLDNEAKAGPWVYIISRKDSGEYDHFCSYMANLKKLGLIENAFRVLEKNKKHIEKDSRFIEYNKFIDNLVIPNNIAIGYAVREWNRDYKNSRNSAFSNLEHNIDDKNHVLRKLAKTMSSDKESISSYKFRAKVANSPNVKIINNALEEVRKLIDKYIPLADTVVNKSDHMKDYIKWGLDNMDKDGVILSVPDILIK